MQYAGIGDEHRAVRTRAGVFDVSHMGELRIAGDGAREYLQARLSNDLDRIGAGHAQYTLLTNERGGIVDDLIAYRRDDDDLLVVNAANVEADHDALAEAEDVSSEWAYLAVQGPEARAARARDRAVRVSGGRRRPASAVSWRHGLHGRAWLRAGLFAGGRRRALGRDPRPRCRAVRLGARDTLRLEVCYPLHGNDISAERTPIEAGPAGPVRSRRTSRGRRPSSSEGPGQPRSWRPSSWRTRGFPASMRIVEGGEVTSGTLSPMLDVGIGLGYVQADLASPTRTSRSISAGGPPARIVRKPFYKREES